MKTITSKITGRIWMDRNIGAHCRAIYPEHKMAYGTHHTWDEAMEISKNTPGFRLPTIKELKAEQIQNSTDAIKKLAFPSAGFRDNIDGSTHTRGSWGTVWSSNISDQSSYNFCFNLSYANSYYSNCTYRFSVRLIKE